MQDGTHWYCNKRNTMYIESRGRRGKGDYLSSILREKYPKVKREWAEQTARED